MFKEVIKIFVNFTDEEKIDIEALESEYMQRLSELEELMEKLHPAPDTDALFVGINAVDNPDEWQEAYDKENSMYDEWYRTGSKEWRKARKDWDKLNDELNIERFKLFRKAEEREFSELEGDPDKILKDAKSQVLRLVRELPESLGKNSILELDRVYVEYRINSSLELHIEVLKEYESLYKEFTSFVDEVLRRTDDFDLESSVYVKPKGAVGKGKLAIAKQLGAVTSIKPYSLTITDKIYRHALTPYKNASAYIQQLDDNFIKQLEFDPETATMSFKNQEYEPIAIQHENTREDFKELDLQLLRSLYTVIYNNYKSIDTSTVSIYLPKLCEHLGVNINTGKPYELFKKIRSFENVVGVINNAGFLKILDVIEYDKERNIITFASPYMNKILRELTLRNTETPKKGDTFINPHYSYLVHGDIAKERNKIAIEIVQRIIVLLHQRGVNKDRAYTEAHIKYQTIVNEIPVLNEKIQSDMSTKNKNNYLERAFSKANKLLSSRTDAYKYFKNLKIPEMKTTMSTLDDVITISHEGINELYSQ